MSKTQQVLLPDIGDFDSVEVIEVLVEAGDVIEKETALITLESDKATMDVPAPFGGTVSEVNVALGDQIAQGDLIVVMHTDSAAPAAARAPESAETTAVATDSVAPADGDAETDIVKIDKDFSVRQGVMNSQDSQDRDDGIGLVTGDDYERFRLLMNLRTLTKSSRRYGQIQQTLELARLLCMGAATGASLFGHPEYVVVALAVVGGLSAFATLLGGQQRVAMLISTISELHRIRIWWYSLSTVERRLLQHRERLVADTEGVLLTLAGAWAAASIKRARAAQDPDKKENDDVAPMRQRRPEAA